MFQVDTNDGRHVDGGDGAAHRGIRRRPGLRLAFDHCVQDVIAELAVTAFDSVHADFVGQLNRGAQSPERGQVGAADALEAFAAELWFVPAFGCDRAPEAVDHFVADVEKSRTFGCLQPLVRAGGIHIAAQVVEVEAHHAGNVRSVDGGDDAFAARQGAELLGG